MSWQNMQSSKSTSPAKAHCGIQDGCIYWSKEKKKEKRKKLEHKYICKTHAPKCRKVTMPAETDPPGELMYIVMSCVGSVLARYNICATSTCAISSFTSPPRIIMRSCNNLDMTSIFSPLPVSTIGILTGGMVPGGSCLLGSISGSRPGEGGWLGSAFRATRRRSPSGRATATAPTAPSAAVVEPAAVPVAPVAARGKRGTSGNSGWTKLWLSVKAPRPATPRVGQDRVMAKKQNLITKTWIPGTGAKHSKTIALQKANCTTLIKGITSGFCKCCLLRSVEKIPKLKCLCKHVCGNSKYNSPVQASPRPNPTQHSTKMIKIAENCPLKIFSKGLSKSLVPCPTAIALFGMVDESMSLKRSLSTAHFGHRIYSEQKRNVYRDQS